MIKQAVCESMIKEQNMRNLQVKNLHSIKDCGNKSIVTTSTEIQFKLSSCCQGEELNVFFKRPTLILIFFWSAFFKIAWKYSFFKHFYQKNCAVDIFHAVNQKTDSKQNFCQSGSHDFFAAKIKRPAYFAFFRKIF